MLVGQINGDERYSAIVEPNLYSNAIFQPGITYTDKYEVADAFAAKVAKVGVGAYADPSTGVGDYSHEAASDGLITIPYNNCFKESKKMYNIQMQSVSYNMGEENLAVAIQKVRVRKDRSGVACLVHEGTVSSVVDASTATTLKANVLAVKKELMDDDANPTVAICTNEFYTTMLSIANNEFTSDVKNFVSQEGQVGRWLGILWIPTSILNLPSAKYYDNTGVLQTVDFSNIEFVMYDADAFSILGNVTDNGLYDGHPDFNGVAAQNELYAGFKVTNPKRARVKKVTG